MHQPAFVTVFYYTKGHLGLFVSFNVENCHEQEVVRINLPSFPSNIHKRFREQTMKIAFSSHHLSRLNL